MSAPTLELVPFHGTTITALRDGEDVRVAVRPVCDSLGIDHSAQLKRLKRQPWAGVVMMATPSSGGMQEAAFVDRRTFTMWLATIDTSRIKNDLALIVSITLDYAVEALRLAREEAAA